MGFFTKLICFFTGIKSMQDEFNKHPSTFVKYVLDKGYTTSAQQRDFCDRFNIDYFQFKKALEKEKSVNSWATELTSVWAGNPYKFTFEYTDSNGSTRKRNIDVDEILLSNQKHFYLKGICLESNEERHFNTERIKNLFIDGCQTNIFDWCASYLNIDLFSILPTNTKSNIKKVVWEGNCPSTTFTYRNFDREKITVSPIRLEQHGSYLNLVAIHNGVEKTFFSQKIETMLATEGYKKMHFNDWVSNVLSVQG